MKTEIGQIFYRYFDNGSLPKLTEWKVIKLTPKGVWVERVWKCGVDYWTNEEFGIDDLPILRKWTRTNHYKMYAYPTEELALKSYALRKHSHLGRLKTKMDNISKILHEIDPDNKIYEEYKEDCDQYNHEMMMENRQEMIKNPQDYI